MKIIYGNRQSGRTTELIKMCAQDRYSLIVCPNIYMCNSVYQLSRELGHRIIMPITIHQFASGQFENKQIENLYFDELEYSLQSLGKNVPVKAFVFNKQFTEIEEVKTGMTEFRTDVENNGKDVKYNICFSTDNEKHYKLVQIVSRLCIDGSLIAIDKLSNLLREITILDCYHKGLKGGKK